MFLLMLGRRHRTAVEGRRAQAEDTVVDLIPFIHVTDVARSIAFYEALGFRLGKAYAPRGRLYTRSLDALCTRLLAHGFQPGEIRDGSPGPEREMSPRFTDNPPWIVVKVPAPR